LRKEKEGKKKRSVVPLCRFTHLLHGGTLIDVCGDTPLLCEKKKKAKQRVAAPRMPPFGSFFQIPSTPKRRNDYVLQGQPFFNPAKFFKIKIRRQRPFLLAPPFLFAKKRWTFLSFKGV
jgi:hypothetical protein